MNIIKTKFKKKELLNSIETAYLKTDLPKIEIGDTLRVGFEVLEGDKKRIQAYEGVVISKKNQGINLTVTVRATLQGIGVERCFLLHSPKIKSLEVKRSSRIRRAKLYYLRNLSGKAARLKERFKKN
jgi:large subunit ribosomal protein L19|nr:ribosomal protein L19 [Meringosphaera mediterranea]WLD06329.1 ribosomal protein L19 [Meringosphaera mediterranea]